VKIVFDKLAQLELDDALEYYELEMPGLGARFKVEVKHGIRRIREYPDAWAKEKKRCKKVLPSQIPLQDTLFN